MILSECLFGQYGIHQIHKAELGKDYNSSVVYTKSERKVLNKSNNLTRSIFGFLPYWENANYKYINYNLLTHIALFDFAVDENGDVSIPPNIFANSWNNVISNSRNFNIKVLMTVTNFDSIQINSIIGNTTSKNNFFAEVNSIISHYNLDGIIVDFEAPKFKDRGEPMNIFMNELNTYLKNENSLLEVAFASPAVNWGGRWNLKGLAESCDYLFLMGYDYYGSWSSSTGPTSPLISSSQSLTRSLELDYKDVVNNYPEKLILGIPYYGLHFKANSPNVGAPKIDKVISPRYRESSDVYLQYGKQWYVSFDVPYTYWQSDNLWNQYFVDDDSSISLKYDLAINRQLKGVGIWALGYDGNKEELWNLIAQKFETTVSVNENENLPAKTELLQNYPNPFNPSTKIQFSVDEPANITLQIFNALGQLIKNFNITISSPGSRYVLWNGRDSFDIAVASGVYYCRIIIGKKSGFTEMHAIKMMMVK